MKIITSNPLFLITRLSSKIRIFIVVSITACYGLFLYEVLPEYLFNTTLSLYYFVFPVIIICTILIAIPKAMTKRSGNQPGNEVEQNIMQTELVNENTPIEVKQENNMIMTNNDAGGMVSDIIMPSPQSHSSDVSSQYQQQPKIDETTINDMVVRAIEPFQREVSRIQDTVNDVRGEINSIRSTIQELTSTFETSLTDLKAFQTEIANPLNFMRKYFDSIDIKGLSDPTLPLHVEQPYINTRNNTIENPMEKINHLEESNPDTSSDNNSSTQFVKQSEEPLSKHEVQESLPLNQLFNGGLTLGKLMTTTTILEEILQTVDRSSIDILIEQCKLMGLRQEDEHVIYNIINLMDQSGLSVKEILVMLYKFGKVMGIADKEADLTYAKLIMNQNKMHGTAITTESRV
ncbi:MAG: hypothetical protein ABI342_01205 [Nitrososphaera sp.]